MARVTLAFFDRYVPRPGQSAGGDDAGRQRQRDRRPGERRPAAALMPRPALRAVVVQPTFHR